MGGASNISVAESPGSLRQIRNATHLFVHLQFDRSTKENDLAILRTDKRFKSNDYLDIIEIKSDGPEKTLSCDFAGWGRTGEVLL